MNNTNNNMNNSNTGYQNTDFKYSNWKTVLAVLSCLGVVAMFDELMILPAIPDLIHQELRGPHLLSVQTRLLELY